MPFDRVALIQGDTALTPEQGRPTAAFRSRSAACRFARPRRPRASALLAASGKAARRAKPDDLTVEHGR